jgi:hypothetical protein
MLRPITGCTALVLLCSSADAIDLAPSEQPTMGTLDETSWVTQAIRAEIAKSQRAQVQRDVWMEARIASLGAELEEQKNQIDSLTSRIAEWESNDSSRFQTHRRNQDATSATCGPQALESMLDACCDGSGNGHRRVQVGCESLPVSCPHSCATQFIPIYEGCQASAVMEGLAP